LLLLLAPTLALAAERVSLPLDQPWRAAAGLLPGALAEQYTAYHVTVLPKNGGLRWVFTPKQDHAELMIPGPPPAASDFALTLSLASGDPATVGLEAFGGDWVQRTSPQYLPRGEPVTLSVSPKRQPLHLGILLVELKPGQKYVVDVLKADYAPSAAAPPRPELPPAALAQQQPEPLLRPDLLPAPEALHRLPAAAAFSPYGRSADVWLAPDQWDYSDLDARLAALLTADPTAQILVQVELDSPPWWDAAHPDQLAPAPTTGPELEAERKLTHASWYSPMWQAAARDALQRLVKHVEALPGGAHVFAYELQSGRGGRWAPWNQTAACLENSPALQTAYRAWLQHKYGDLAALRVAWGQPRQPWPNSPEVKAGYILTQWAQIKPPAASALLGAAGPSLYDPSGQEHLADYQRFLGDSTADTILSLVKAGRAASTGRQWGACYGGLLWWPTDEWAPSLSGGLGLSKLLAGPDLDFLTGPPEAPVAVTGLAGSVRQHGKVWLEQPAAGVAPAPAPEPGVLAPAVYVVDEASLAHLGPGADLERTTLQEQAAQLTASEIPWEGWLLGDLPAAPDNRRLYVMAATYYLPDRVRAALENHLHRPGTATVWLYAPAALDGGYIDPSAIFRLTGIKTTLYTSGGSLRVTLPAGDPLLTPDQTEPLVFGPQDPVQPRLVLIGGAEAAGTVADSGWGALGVRRDHGAIIVYSAAPGLPAAVLRNLLTATANP
jgi:hypothetical protein